ncbi:MAG: hypothetical protein ACRDNB_01830 [Gaiellaceae bacterium]
MFVRLEFALPAAKRVFLIVRGPAPSCRIAGVVPLRGRKGENAVDFAGRVRGRTLDPGVYVLTISPTRRLGEGAPTEYVRVASPRRTVPLPDGAAKPTCSSQQLGADGAARFLRTEPSASAPQAQPSAPFRPPLLSAPPSASPEDSGGGLGPIPAPATIGPVVRDSASTVVAILALIFAIGLIAIAIGLVARIPRGRPSA